jgi:hypothetical protein
MRRWLVVLVVLTVACTQGGQSAVKSASPSPASNVAPTASPVPGDLPLSRVTFSCRLPIMTPDKQGGFISFPAGTVRIDPQAQALADQWGLYYDRAFSRWLPVPRQAVSPDGRHYAYGQRGADQSQVPRMHVVDVVTGADRVFDTPTNPWFVRFDVIDYAAEGIYLYTGYEVSIGVSIMNPTTGAIQPLANLPDIQASAGNRAFWVGTVNPADPNPLGGLETQPNQIDRFSLVDSSRVPWFYRPSTAPRVIGSDLQGHPIVMVVNGKNGFTDADYGAELIVVTSPQSQGLIFSGPANLVTSMFISISDSHGTWFGTDHGVYLYTGTAFLKVSNQPGYPANGCL